MSIYTFTNISSVYKKKTNLNILNSKLQKKKNISVMCVYCVYSKYVVFLNIVYAEKYDLILIHTSVILSWGSPSHYIAT